jgi:hypothetical protein
MRIWDIPPDKLCQKHLLGEHSELHAIWSILINGKKGFAYHPETLRWKGKLKALYVKHEQLADEMKKRGFHHNSPLNSAFAIGKVVQNDLVDTIEDQIQLLRTKKCSCKV